MENLTNEQIISIIEFYKECGISEDIYLSNNNVLDLFTLLGFSPEFDEDGNRLPTVYEQLETLPKVEDGKEVPIVFAIKHKVSGIFKPQTSSSFTYVGANEEKTSDDIILKKFRQDYFSALANGNMIEATRVYDLIDKLTGGNADEFIGIQYEYVKFYKKMQRQLMLDIFSNFVILMVLSNKLKIKDGLVRFDKLYKAFVEKEMQKSGIKLSGDLLKAPAISKMTIENVGEDKQKIEISADNKGKGEFKAKSKIVSRSRNVISFIKSKIGAKLEMFKMGKLFSQKEERPAESIADDIKVEGNSNISDKSINILENN